MKQSTEDKIKSKISLINKMEEVAEEYKAIECAPSWIEDIQLIKESIINLLKEEYHEKSI
tara:strand:- start:86 stop:265 length:180 start_codon:yes stop_codon:yes gene_type:complete